MKWNRTLTFNLLTLIGIFENKCCKYETGNKNSTTKKHRWIVNRNNQTFLKDESINHNKKQCNKYIEHKYINETHVETKNPEYKLCKYCDF